MGAVSEVVELVFNIIVLHTELFGKSGPPILRIIFESPLGVLIVSPINIVQHSEFEVLCGPINIFEPPVVVDLLPITTLLPEFLPEPTPAITPRPIAISLLPVDVEALCPIAIEALDALQSIPMAILLVLPLPSAVTLFPMAISRSLLVTALLPMLILQFAEPSIRTSSQNVILLTSYISQQLRSIFLFEQSKNVVPEGPCAPEGPWIPIGATAQPTIMS